MFGAPKATSGRLARGRAFVVCLDEHILLEAYFGEMSAFAVVAEPTRRRILDELIDGEQPVNALVERLGLSQPRISKHLKVLRDAGLVAVRVDRQSRKYRLHADSLVEIEEWLSPYRKFWTGRLDALERHLDGEASDD